MSPIQVTFKWLFIENISFKESKNVHSWDSLTTTNHLTTITAISDERERPGMAQQPSLKFFSENKQL